LVNVRFAPKSGLSSAVAECPLSANCCREQVQQISLAASTEAGVLFPHFGYKTPREVFFSTKNLPVALHR
jgi:hypothetical protein